MAIKQVVKPTHERAMLSAKCNTCGAVYEFEREDARKVGYYYEIDCESCGAQGVLGDPELPEEFRK